MQITPVVLFVYNREDHTIRTIEALKNNILASETDLIIYSDAAKKESDKDIVQRIRNYIKSVSGFKSIQLIEQKENQGLSRSIINGVTQVCNDYGKAIILEDDLVTSKYFLSYMNDALDFYTDYKRVFSVTGYGLSPDVLKISDTSPYDVYFGYRGSSWGWATWKDRWEQAIWDMSIIKGYLDNADIRQKFCEEGTDLIDMMNAQFENKIDSWAIRWAFTNFLKGAVCAQPFISYVDNIGFDGSGVHSSSSLSIAFRNDLSKSKDSYNFALPIKEDSLLIDRIGHFWSNIYNVSLGEKIKRRFAKTLKRLK